MKINLIIFICFFILILADTQYITTPFVIKYFNESETDIVGLQRKIIVEVEASFGSKKEKFKLSCDLDSSAIIIPDSNCEQLKNKEIKKFDRLSSSDTFEMVTNITMAIDERFYSGIEGKDNFQLGSFNNKIKFVVVDTFSFTHQFSNLYYAFLGLDYDVHPSINKFQSFFNQLKENNLISHKCWYLDFNSDKTGKLVIGALPHELDNNTFPEDTKQSFQLEDNSKIYQMDFYEIYLGKIDEYDKRKKTERMNVLFSLSSRVMECQKDFWQYIKDFFDGKGKNICELEIKSNYEYYYCYKDKFNMQEMDNVNFYIKDKEYTFVFEPKDLFYEKDNKLYYLIIHNTILDADFRWIIGTLFFEKYTIVFNKENKEQIVYLKKPNQKQNDETPKSTYIIIIVVLSVVLLASIAIFIFYLIKIKPRKKKANELDEDFDYHPKDNEKGETPILDE